MDLNRLLLQKAKGFNPSKILDIGAHIGVFYENIKEIWPDADVLSIEANPYAEKTLAEKGIPYKIAALSKEVGKSVNFYISKEWILSSGNSIYKENTPSFSDDKCISIQLITNTLDNMLRGDFFEFIKLDTQGSEVDILTGGINLIKNTKMIMIECSVKEYNIGGARIGDVFNFMNYNNFILDDIIDTMYNDNQELVQTDLLFIRK